MNRCHQLPSVKFYWTYNNNIYYAELYSLKPSLPVTPFCKYFSSRDWGKGHSPQYFFWGRAAFILKVLSYFGQNV